MRRILAFLAVTLLVCSAFGLEFEDERHDLNYGWREPEDHFGLYGRRNAYPTRTATRREDVDSSEEDKDSSESPLDLDVVSGTIGNSKPSIGSGSDSGVPFNRPIDPFFSPFFNVFNLGFPGFGVPQSIPWWRGSDYGGSQI